MIKKNINIEIDTGTRMVFFSDGFLGLDGENLQGNIVFSFSDFVEGVPRVEVIQKRDKFVINEVERINDTYVMPIKSSLMQGNNITMQLVITEGTEPESIPVFKSKEFVLTIAKSINAEETIPEQYDSWIDIANAKINQIQEAIENANATSEELIRRANEGEFDGRDGVDGLPGKDGYTPIKGKDYFDGINGKDGLPGKDGIDGKDYVITEKDYEEIASKVTPYDDTEIRQEIALKQDELVSGTNIKTINGEDILGEGNIEIQGGSSIPVYSISRFGSSSLELNNEATQNELVELLNDFLFNDVNFALVNNHELLNNISQICSVHPFSNSNTQFYIEFDGIAKKGAYTTNFNGYYQSINSGYYIVYLNPVEIENGLIENVYSSSNLKDKRTVSINGLVYGFLSEDYIKSLIPSNNTKEWTITNDYNPVHKKYVDDNISSAIGDIDTLLQDLDNGGGVE